MKAWALWMSAFLRMSRGNPTPSDADRRLTRRLREASETMGIPLQDHLIIGTPSESRELPYFSFREHGLL